MTSTPDPDAAGPDAGGVGVLVDPVAGAAVGSLLAGVGEVCAVQPWRLSDEDLATLLQHSEVARRRLVMVQVAAVVEAGKRGLPRRAGFGPGRGGKGADTAALAAWVRSLVNVSRGRAREVAEVGAALFTDPGAADLAQTKAAALAGQITARHVAAIADAITQLSPPLTPEDVVDADTRADAQRLLPIGPRSASLRACTWNTQPAHADRAKYAQTWP